MANPIPYEDANARRRSRSADSFSLESRLAAQWEGSEFRCAAVHLPTVTRCCAAVATDSVRRSAELRTLQRSGAADADPIGEGRMRSLPSQQALSSHARLTRLSSKHGLTEEISGPRSVKTPALLMISCMCLIGCIIWLRAVLIPFILAAFFMFLLEPLLFLVLNPWRVCRGCSERAARRARATETQRLLYLGDDEESVGRKRSRRRMIWWRMRAVAAVFACLLVIAVFIAGCGFLIIKSVADFSWKKYEESPRLKRMANALQLSGGASTNATQGLDTGPFNEYVVQGPLLSAVATTFSAISTLLLMFLFLVFMLLSHVGADPETEFFGFGRKARVSVQLYLRIKMATSISVSLVIWFVLTQLEVDLAFMFAFITFLLNWIPHIGYVICVLAPLPLVYLDPDKTMGDLVACIIWPTLIHQVFSNMIEPRLLATSLDLHPMIVLTMVAFWTVCWGAVGAVLSTPLTGAARLALAEMKHPYARLCVNFLRGRLFSGRSVL